MKTIVVVFMAVTALYVRTPQASADALSELVAGTDSASDDLVIALLQSADLQESIDIVRALGGRSDPRVDNIIRHLLSYYKSESWHVTEHLLRLIVDTVFSPERPNEATRHAVRANSEAVSVLLKRLDSFRSPQLRRLLLLLSPYVPAPTRRDALPASGRRLVSLLRQENGEPDPETVGEVLAFLHAASLADIPELAPYCVSLRRLTRSAAVADAAAQAARLLLAASNPSDR